MFSTGGSHAPRTAPGMLEALCRRLDGLRNGAGWAQRLFKMGSVDSRGHGISAGWAWQSCILPDALQPSRNRRGVPGGSRVSLNISRSLMMSSFVHEAEPKEKGRPVTRAKSENTGMGYMTPSRDSVTVPRTTLS